MRCKWVNRSRRISACSTGGREKMSSEEVRVFPILQVDGHVPDCAEHVYGSLRSKKIEVSFVCVPPTLHKGADRVLVLRR